MVKELAFVLINPYTIAKSRTGGIIARYISRTGLDLVAARMFAPNEELAKAYAQLIRADLRWMTTFGLFWLITWSANMAPTRPRARRRVMMLLFEGENAIQRVKEVTGRIRPTNSGETVRDTYGDYILDASGAVHYLEPPCSSAPRSPPRAKPSSSGPNTALNAAVWWVRRAMSCRTKPRNRRW